MRKLVVALGLCLVVMTPAVARAGTEVNPHDLTAAQRRQLEKFRDVIEVVNDLERQGLLGKEVAESTRNGCCVAASAVVGRSFTTEEFLAYMNEADKTVGFGVFLNLLIILAGAVLFLALIGLILYYLWPFFVRMPPSFYEVSAYLVTAILLFGALLSSPFTIWFLRIDPLWFVVPGAIAFPCCLMLSRLNWGLKASDKEIDDSLTFAKTVFLGPGFFRFHTFLFGICTLVWGGLAVMYHQKFPNAGIPYFLAFISVMSLESFLGFSVITMPGCIAMGWEKDSAIPRSVMASFILMVVYIFIKLSGNAAPEPLMLFSAGCLFMGAFVFFLGLLVMSSKWYAWAENNNNYISMQIITVICGLLALYLGSSFGIGTLLGIGGTFFAIYLLEKYYEIPWKGVGWAWSLLGVAIGLYFFIGFASKHPEYFVWGIRSGG